MKKPEQQIIKLKNECIDIIEQDEWDYFIRFSSNLPLTYFHCRPLMVKYFEEMRKFRSHFFWVAKPMENNTGYDIFAVLSVPLMVSKITMMGYTYYETCWQNVTERIKHDENLRRIMAEEDGEELKFKMEIKRLASDANITEILIDSIGNEGVEFDYFK